MPLTGGEPKTTVCQRCSTYLAQADPNKNHLTFEPIHSIYLPFDITFTNP
jgi:hypothetical protein